MEVSKKKVAAAGRVIMDVIQAEWEPLSHWELDQRLDRAVEEMIEADLVAQVQEQSASVTMQASQHEEDSTPPDQAQTETPPRLTESVGALQRSHITEAMEANPAIQVGQVSHALSSYYITAVVMLNFHQGGLSNFQGGFKMTRWIK